RLDPFTDGTLDQCLVEKMTPLAWSPLAQGTLGDGGDGFPGGRKTSAVAERIVPVLDAIARAHGSSRTNVALAWLLKHPSKIVPIVGSTNADRIREATQAVSLELSREEWYRLLIAARGEPLP
ncbi:MAG: aldo/keto reductase, partial [Pedosphaera sp.]|nr:aldo/keto reductase [Pedosphaera sp.]